MKCETIILKKFYVVGLSIRTTNENGQSKKDICKLKAEFLGENRIEQIPEKASNDIYCLYTDYECKVNGPFTVIVGCKVKSIKNVPPGFVSKAIPPMKYEVYKSKPKMPAGLLDTWRHVLWQSEINRKFAADFDLYKNWKESADENRVEIYISVV